MEVFRLFRGFRMQTRKNCQPQSHLSVIECLKGHFRLKIQAFRNSAFLLLQRSKEIKVVAFSMCWEKPRSCARDSGICCEDCWSWNKLKLSVSSCLAYKGSLFWRAGHSLKPGATVGGKNWNVYVPLVLFSVDSRQFIFCARIPQTNLIRTIVLPSKWLSTTLCIELHMINSVKLTVMTHTWRNLCKYLLTKIFSGQLTSFVYFLQVVINPQYLLLSHIS